LKRKFPKIEIKYISTYSRFRNPLILSGIVLGNGESRLQLPHKNAKFLDTIIFGCNAYYRKSYRVPIGMLDPNMCIEFLKNENPSWRDSYDRGQYGKRFFSSVFLLDVRPDSPVDLINWWGVRRAYHRKHLFLFSDIAPLEEYDNLCGQKRKNCGVFVLYAMLKLNPQLKDVFLIGFDFGSNKEGYLNNVYKDTDYYSSTDKKYNEESLRMPSMEIGIEKIVKLHPQTNFYRVECYEPFYKNFSKFIKKNIPNISWEDMISMVYKNAEGGFIHNRRYSSYIYKGKTLLDEIKWVEKKKESGEWKAFWKKQSKEKKARKKYINVYKIKE